MDSYKEWIKRAKSIFKFAVRDLDEDMYYIDACHILQEAVEKAFKGLIIFYGIKHEKTHSISRLINELKKHTDIPDYIFESSKLTEFTILLRYPGDFNDVSKEEYENLLNITKRCLEWVDIKVSGLF